MSEENIDSPDEAVAAHAELYQKGRYKAINAMMRSARSEVNEHIADCVNEDAIDLVACILNGLGVDTSYHLNHPSSNELIAMLTSLTEVALIRSGQYANGDLFDLSVLEEGDDDTKSDVHLKIVTVQLPSLSGLTALPELSAESTK